MKKRILASLLMGISSIAFSLYPNVAEAKSTEATTLITGYVAVRDNEFSVAGFKVSVTCLDYFTGQYYGYGQDTVDAGGSYLIRLPAQQCPAGSRLLGGAGDDEGLHYGHGRNYGETVINSKLIIYEGDIGMLW